MITTVTESGQVIQRDAPKRFRLPLGFSSVSGMLPYCPLVHFNVGRSSPECVVIRYTEDKCSEQVMGLLGDTLRLRFENLNRREMVVTIVAVDSTGITISVAED